MRTILENNNDELEIESNDTYSMFVLIWISITILINIFSYISNLLKLIGFKHINFNQYDQFVIELMWICIEIITLAD